MFNQVLVHPDDQVFHRFSWRSDKSETPSVFQWRRLNFGDKPAPDIASNAINYLAKVSQVEFPDAAQELQDHAYVDDIAGSKSNSTEAKKKIREIDTVLGKGQFQIKAWKLTSLVVRDLQTCLATNGIKKKTSLPSRKKTWLAYWRASPKEAV